MPAHSAFEPEQQPIGMRRAGDRDDHGRIGPREVLAARTTGSAATIRRCATSVRAPHAGQNGASSSHRPRLSASTNAPASVGVTANRRPRAARPSRPARRTSSSSPRANTAARSAVAARRPARGRPIPRRRARAAGGDPVQRAGVGERRGVAVEHEHPGRGIRSRRARADRASRAPRRRGRGRSRPAAEAACCRAPSSRTSLPLVDKPGVARGRTGAPDLPWAHGTLTPHSSRVRDLGSAPGRRRRSRRAHRRRGRSLRRRARRTRRRTTRRRARSRRRGRRAPNSPPRRARCVR